MTERGGVGGAEVCTGGIGGGEDFGGGGGVGVGDPEEGCEGTLWGVVGFEGCTGGIGGEVEDFGGFVGVVVDDDEEDGVVCATVWGTGLVVLFTDETED